EAGRAPDPPRYGRPLGGSVAGGGAAPDPGHLGSLRSRALRPARLDPGRRAAAARPPGGDPPVRTCAPDREAPAGQSTALPIPPRRPRDHPPRARSATDLGARIPIPTAPPGLPGNSPAELLLSR